jgi:hypothetical protein
MECGHLRVNLELAGRYPRDYAQGGAASDAILLVVVGYSGTPLATKLGIKEGARVVMLYAPEGFAHELPPGVRVSRRARGSPDVAMAFFVQLATLERRLTTLRSIVFPAGGLWIAWPKRSSRVETDLTDTVIRDLVLPTGLVDNKVCAIDGTWSALRFVWRLEHRGGGATHPPPT